MKAVEQMSSGANEPMSSGVDEPLSRGIYKSMGQRVALKWARRARGLNQLKVPSYARVSKGERGCVRPPIGGRGVSIFMRAKMKLRESNHVAGQSTHPFHPLS